MNIKLRQSQLAEIPPFDTIVDQAVRHAYEQNARALERTFSEKVAAIIVSHIADPILAASLHGDIMYLLTHTEVAHPPIISSTMEDSPIH